MRHLGWVLAAAMTVATALPAHAAPVKAAVATAYSPLYSAQTAPAAQPRPNVPAPQGGPATGGGNTVPSNIVVPLGAQPGAPYGSNLFAGQFASDGRLGLNPNYKIQPGDTIAVALWGGGEQDANLNLPVDAQGMIFIPNVGPVKVGGVEQGNLNRVVSEQVSKYYQDTVQVYTALQGAQTVAVYVTGGVVTPGRYGGEAADSLLQYLDRAKGVDATRGSYRTIDVLRGGDKIATVDIYDFLQRGTIPHVELKENDVIFVHGLAHTVMVAGAVQNPYRFEFTSPTITGAELIDMARPTPVATHAIVTGIRDGQGFANYLTLADLANTDIHEGDAVEFKAGTLTATLSVTIEGEHLGPQVVVAPADARINEVLRHVRVDKKLADIDSIYLRRKSVAVRQKIALQESLRRLEEMVLTAPATTVTDSALLGEESRRIEMFIQRAGQVEPEGRVVVSEGGTVRDIALEDGDTIVIPRRTNLVMVNGEVMMPKAVVFKEGAGTSYYIERAGGFTERADEGRHVLARLNGETLADSEDVQPGDEIIVMPEVGFSQLQVTKDVVDILYKVAIAVAVPLTL